MTPEKFELRVMEPDEGPCYPDLPSLAPWRRCAATREGRDPEFRKAYGAAVGEAIRALQRRELYAHGFKGPAPRKPRGHDSGKEIDAETRDHLAKQMRAGLAKDWDQRLKTLEIRYHEHMKRQRAAIKRLAARPKARESAPVFRLEIDEDGVLQVID